MGLIEDQLNSLQELRPGATLRRLPSGAFVVDVPTVPLGPGWNKRATAVHFVVPLGYPHAKPDCFWADQDLRLENGAMPQAANSTPLPEVNEACTWFSWHATQWNPNRDSLTTYYYVIANRLRDPR